MLIEKAGGYITEADPYVSPFYPVPILLSTSPTKIVEYMAMGKPVVANDHPEQKRMIEKSEGGTFVAYDKLEFADAIVRFLSDLVNAKTMARLGRVCVEKHRSYCVIAASLEEKY